MRWRFFWPSRSASTVHTDAVSPLIVEAPSKAPLVVGVIVAPTLSMVMYAFGKLLNRALRERVGREARLMPCYRCYENMAFRVNCSLLVSENGDLSLE
jgi:hypothetical protein